MNKLIFLDTETTSKDGRLIQLAFSISDDSNKVFDNMFKPPERIEIEAMSVHHITEEMVSQKEIFEESATKRIIESALNDHILICHNVAFDSGVLVREGLTVNQKICTMKVAQTLLDFPQYKLQYLRYALNLRVKGNAHDAGGDVAVLIELFDRLLLHMLENDLVANEDAAIEKMIEITANPVLLKRFTFGKYKGQRFVDVKDAGYLKWMLGTDIDGDLRYTINHYMK